MTPLATIEPGQMTDGWRCIDFMDDCGLIAVVPNHGPTHRAGLDCWCRPVAEEDGRLIIHNEAH